MAGATKAIWQSRTLGTGLFEGGQWRSTEVRTAFASTFRSFEPLADPQPVLVTEPFGPPAPFVVGATPWQLRLARVTLADEALDWYAWPPFLTGAERETAFERRAGRR